LLNVLHIIGTFNTGGIQKFVLQLISSECLNEFNHQVVSTILHKGNYKVEYEKNNIKLTHLPFTFSPKTYIPHRIDKQLRFLLSKLYFFRMLYYLGKSEIDIVHSHIPSQIISQILATIFAGKRIIWTIHGEYSLSRLTIWFLRILESALPNTKFQIIADSIPALHSTIPYTVKNPKPDNIIRTGIEIEPYLQKYDKSIIREKYNIEDDIIIIGSTGRIVWQKRYDQLISLLENYNFNEKKYHFLIAGEGSLRNKLITEVKKQKLHRHITFIGNIKNIPEFLSAIDIYIQPSATEGFPLSVLEAMAAGLPIICSDAGGLKEMIHHNETGIIYKSGDLSALYEGFIKMFSMLPDELCQLGRNARKIVQDKYSINNCSLHYNTIYNLDKK